MVLFTVGQLVLLWVGFGTGMKWPFFPLWLGLEAMRLLPADPRTAGSFIVFPTLPQIVLAVVVNNLLYGVIFKLVEPLFGRQRSGSPQAKS